MTITPTQRIPQPLPQRTKCPKCGAPSIAFVCPYCKADKVDFGKTLNEATKGKK